MPTLAVDGNNLLTIGFFGLKNHFYKGKHIGALYHFINTLRRSFDTHQLDKICVFWDGEESTFQRKKIYSHYKSGVKSRIKSEEEISSFNYQRTRVQQYLEELYVRQGEYKYCEADDGIAFYTQNAPDEEIIIYSSDRDLTQLVNKKVSLYNPSHGKMYGPGDLFEYEHEEILIENVKLIKMICGDPSDNIFGIKNFGLKKLINLCPEIKTSPLTIEDVVNRGNLLFEQDKDNKLVQNLLTGVSKLGVFGDELLELNHRLVDLTDPLLTEEAKVEILQLINDDLDTEGRSYKNTMKMMVEDGMFQFLPKQDDAWVKFFNPFLRLARKEKNKHIFKYVKPNGSTPP